MKKIILTGIAIVVLIAAGLSFKQYLSYQDCKTQSRQAALDVYPNDPTHPEYDAKRTEMETNLMKTCHKFSLNIGT